MGVASTKEAVYVLTEKHLQVWTGSGEHMHVELELTSRIEAFTESESSFVYPWASNDIELRDVALRR